MLEAFCNINVESGQILMLLKGKARSMYLSFPPAAKRVPAKVPPLIMQIAVSTDFKEKESPAAIRLQGPSISYKRKEGKGRGETGGRTYGET